MENKKIDFFPERNKFGLFPIDSETEMVYNVIPVREIEELDCGEFVINNLEIIDIENGLRAVKVPSDLMKKLNKCSCGMHEFTMYLTRGKLGFGISLICESCNKQGKMFVANYEDRIHAVEAVMDSWNGKTKKQENILASINGWSGKTKEQ